jgi:predicted transcriptional regulator
MFLTEKDLVKKIMSSYPLICNWNTNIFQTNLMQEVDLGFGVADLVISKIKNTRGIKESSLSYFDITIYKIIESKGHISLECIRNITKADTYTIKKSLSKLMLDSYVKEIDTFYKLGRIYKSSLSDSIAIEAKLKNWKRALQQAYRYKWFASTAYVVLDNKSISAAIQSIDLFKKMNVGLASITKKGEVSILYKPKKEKPVDKKMEMLLNERVLSVLS